MLSYNVLNSWVEKLMKKDLPVKIKTSDITSLSTKYINKLKAGDIVLKKTGNQKHTYIVSYKENNQGICLTYTDATVIETVSYDYNTTTKEWVYNSTDIGRVGGVEYTAGDGISITDGVIANTKPNKSLYLHTFTGSSMDALCNYSFTIITESATPMTKDDVIKYFKDREFYGQTWNNKAYPAQGSRYRYDYTAQQYHTDLYFAIRVNHGSENLELEGREESIMNSAWTITALPIDYVVPLYTE